MNSNELLHLAVDIGQEPYLSRVSIPGVDGMLPVTLIEIRRVVDQGMDSLVRYERVTMPNSSRLNVAVLHIPLDYVILQQKRRLSLEAA